MTPPAMGMLMPEMAALTSLGVPVLAAGGRKPKNMQPPTQDMAIPPNQTIYVNNINDKVKLTGMSLTTRGVRGLPSSMRTVLSRLPQSSFLSMCVCTRPTRIRCSAGPWNKSFVFVFLPSGKNSGLGGLSRL